MHEKFMIEALKEAKKTNKYDDVPVGVVIVKNNKIIARGYNQKEKHQLATKHAEIIAIENANKKCKNWYLDDCTLYVTMEPCMMCSGAIIESHIKTIVYGCKSEKYGTTNVINTINNQNNYKIEIISGIMEKECSELLKMYFKKKRNK